MRGQITACSTPGTRTASAFETFVDVFTIERKQQETAQNAFKQDHARTERLTANRLIVRAR